MNWKKSRYTGPRVGDKIRTLNPIVTSNLGSYDIGEVYIIGKKGQIAVAGDAEGLQEWFTKEHPHEPLFEGEFEVINDTEGT